MQAFPHRDVWRVLPTVFVPTPIQCTAPSGERYHGYATVRTGLTCRSVRGVDKHPSNFRYWHIQPSSGDASRPLATPCTSSGSCVPRRIPVISSGSCCTARAPWQERPPTHGPPLGHDALVHRTPTPAPCVTFRRVVVPLRGPGQSPVLPFACCVGSLRSVGRCGRCSCWCRFRVRGAQSLVCWGCAEWGMVCRLRVSGAQ